MRPHAERSGAIQWTHLGQRYGDDTSYIKAAQYLDDGPVEDWGGGPGYARKFFHHGYTLVDDTDHEGVDVVVDLVKYTSNTHGILLRHVLEHNYKWGHILNNAVESCQKLAVVIFTPFGFEEDIADASVIAVNPNDSPDISFKKSSLVSWFPEYTEETFPSATQYGQETIFYVKGRL